MSNRYESSPSQDPTLIELPGVEIADTDGMAARMSAKAIEDGENLISRESEAWVSLGGRRSDSDQVTAMVDPPRPSKPPKTSRPSTRQRESRYTGSGMGAGSDEAASDPSTRTPRQVAEDKETSTGMPDEVRILLAGYEANRGKRRQAILNKPPYDGTIKR